MILRGIKTVEYRSRATRIIGERFYIYASKRKLSVVSGQWSVKVADNIVVPTEKLPAWMIELAEQVGMIEPGTLLPTGVIVGSAVIEGCSQLTTDNGPQTTVYQWHLTDIERVKRLRKPKGHPQPVWFEPF